MTDQIISRDVIRAQAKAAAEAQACANPYPPVSAAYDAWEEEYAAHVDDCVGASPP